MKRYIILMLATLVALMPTGCKKSETSDDVVTTPIEVTYTLNGEQVRSLPFNSSSRSVRVDVALNNQYIHWNIISDAEWCSVVEEEHCGDGGFTLNIASNTDFTDRVPARLTFVAGLFRGFEMEVSQSGNVFIVSQVYAIGSKTAGSAEFNVSVQEGVEWSIADGLWLTATKGAQSTADGMVTTAVRVAWDENTAAARYGSVGLVRSGLSEADAQFAVFQFGNETQWNDDGAIALDSKNATALSLKVPAHSVEAVLCPESVTYEAVENADNTVSYAFTVADNPSDTRSVRRPLIAFKMLDRDGEVALPSIEQAYYSVSGITTANGLAMFARTVNEGGDTGDWQRDGKVVLLNNIDMSQLTEQFESAGTAAHPFEGVFDGQYRKIVGFASTQPLFGVCKGATIDNIIFDETSAITSVAEYNLEYSLAPLAARLTDCSVGNCTNYASVTMNATTGNDATKAYVAGLVGIAEGSTTLSACANYGAVEVTDKAQTAKGQGAMYVGGLVALNGATLDNCTNNGSVADAAMAESHYLGGIAGFNTGTVRTATNAGAVTISSLRAVKSDTDDSRNIYIGGVVGMNEGSVTSSTNAAAVVSASDVKLQRIGGIVGRLNKAGEIAGNNNTAQGTITISGTSTTFRGPRQLMLGGLYGEVAYDAALDFATVASTSEGAIAVNAFEASTNNTHIYIGGIVGHADRSSALTLTAPKWNSTISVNVSKVASGAMTFAVGGIVGGAGSIQTDGNFGGHLTVADASVAGKIDIAANTSIAMQHRTGAIGGVAGFVAIGGATFTDCTNDAAVQQLKASAKSNGYAQHMGGIVGFIAGGDSEIRNCTNNGEIDNEHYNNNAWTGGTNNSGSTGGIIGSYGYNTTYAGSITVEHCTNTAAVRSYRGMAGGIAGYLRAATLTDATATGSMGNGNRSYVGGIAGIVEQTAISGCTARCNVGGQSAGSEIYSGGGIVGTLHTGSSVASCAYYGEIVSNTASAGETAGLIAGAPAAGTTIGDCKAGGKVRGTAIGADNASNYVAGNANAAVTGFTYWNGQE